MLNTWIEEALAPRSGCSIRRATACSCSCCLPR